MTSLLVVGYKPFEIGIVSNKDPRLDIIKKAIRRDLIRLIEEGVEWVIFTGNLGFEYWCLEIALELRLEYPLKLATIFTFENQGQNWNEANQEILAKFKGVDFVKYAYPSYQNPGQFKDYNRFVIENTDGVYVFYDEENETNLKYLYQSMKEQEQYSIKRLTFDDLNDLAENFS